MKSAQLVMTMMMKLSLIKSRVLATVRMINKPGIQMQYLVGQLLWYIPAPVMKMFNPFDLLLLLCMDNY